MCEKETERERRKPIFILVLHSIEISQKRKTQINLKENSLFLYFIHDVQHFFELPPITVRFPPASFVPPEDDDPPFGRLRRRLSASLVIS